jgi:hypothetical protein
MPIEERELRIRPRRPRVGRDEARIWQNPSPGRLARTCKAAQMFISDVVAKIRDEIFSTRPGRLRFQTITEVGGVEDRHLPGCRT